MNDIQKHRAILNIAIEIHPLEKSGECSGHIIPTSKFKEYGIQPNKLYKLDGENLHSTLLKLKEILDQLK